MTTKEYREAELQAVYYVDYGYNRSIVISSTRGKTKYLDITEKEYKAIKKILTKGEK